MENAVKERIKKVFRYKDTTLSGFAGNNSSLQKKLSRQINLGGGLTFETISSILDRYPDISAEWLLRGKGDMLSVLSSDIQKVAEAEPAKAGEKEDYLKVIKLQQEQIATLIKLLDNKNYEN